MLFFKYKGFESLSVTRWTGPIQPCSAKRKVIIMKDNTISFGLSITTSHVLDFSAGPFKGTRKQAVRKKISYRHLQAGISAQRCFIIFELNHLLEIRRHAHDLSFRPGIEQKRKIEMVFKRECSLSASRSKIQSDLVYFVEILSKSVPFGKCHVTCHR